MRSIPDEAAVYLWQGRTDMRCGFDRLAEIVSTNLSRSVIGGGVYVFLSRCRRKVKLFYWDNDGYAVWHKRLEAGAFRVELKEGVEEITGVDLQALLSGTDLSRIKMQKNAKNIYAKAAA